MNLDIEIDAKPVQRALGEMGKQFPYALSVAISSVAKDAQADLVKGYQSRFHLRRPDFIRREGAKITKFASKREPVATIEVTQRASFLWKFEDGGTKRPEHGKALAIPLNVRRSKTDIIPKSQRPKALYASKAAASGRIFSRGGLLLQQVGRKAAGLVKVLYVWKSSARIPALLRFKQTVNDTVNRQWEQRAGEAAQKAIDTAR